MSDIDSMTMSAPTPQVKVVVLTNQQAWEKGADLPYELLRTIENAFLEHRPYGKETHVYTMAPRGSNVLRKRLLEMAHSDPVREWSAFALLGQIEVWRLEHGRPMDEPRHPAIESGMHWPI